ncbi:MAG: hypothetical protein RL490_1838 [Pseudomonadota bacterium]
MRLALALALCLAVPAAAATTKPPVKAAPKPAAAPNWVDRYALTPEGGILRGNPRAAVKIIEYGSITCPHCRAFQKESEVALVQRYLPSGRVSIEFRHFLLNGFDLAGVMLVTCQDARKGAALVDKYYRLQTVWTAPFTAISPADGERIAALPGDKQPAALARLGNLAGFAGLDPAVADRCLADSAAIDRLISSRETASTKYGINGTPGFLINGVPQADVFDWANLEPRLKAALQPR